MWNRKWRCTIHVTVDFFFQRGSRFKSRPQISYQMQFFPGAGMEIRQCHYFLEKGPASHYHVCFLSLSTYRMFFQSHSWLNEVGSGIACDCPVEESLGRAVLDSTLQMLKSVCFSFLSDVCVLDFFFLAVGMVRCKNLGKTEEAIDLLGPYTIIGKKFNSLKNQNYIGIEA